MTQWLQPPDTKEVAYEFFAPFAHVEGKYEWCRVRSPAHGVFDLFIVLGTSTAVPATVYVNSVLGQSFMKERYPECTTVRVPPKGLAITESSDGRTVTGRLESEEGPVKEANMTLRSQATAIPTQVPYGGTGAPVWGSQWTCWGVDLNVAGSCDGTIKWQDGKATTMRGAPCIVTLGSFARIAPRA